MTVDDLDLGLKPDKKCLRCEKLGDKSEVAAARSTCGGACGGRIEATVTYVCSKGHRWVDILGDREFECSAMTWQDVDGWLTAEEGDALRALAVNGTVLEFGAYKGRSTVAMAEVARRVVSVDWHRGDASCGHSDTLLAFTANLIKHGVRDKVTPVVGRVGDVGWILKAEAFDLVFIDDDHGQEAVAMSTSEAIRCVRPGGAIAWHDWDYPSVRDTARRMGLHPEEVRGNLAWLRWGGGG